MILHVNHVRPGHAKLAGDVVATLLSLLEDGRIEPSILPHLNVHLDWIQYKTNFREPIILRKAVRNDHVLPMIEIAVDLRQVCADNLRDQLADVLKTASPGAGDAGRVALEPFGPLRSSVVWNFNKLYWQYLPDWERVSGKGYEKALPGGISDGHHPVAIRDSAARFWTLLKDMDSKGQLPPEIFVMEIGVGTAERALRWMNDFKEQDHEHGTQYYPRIRFLVGDYSTATLNRATERLGPHGELCSFLALDALNPFKSLSFLRYKMLYIHLTNVYDNLPTDEIVVRDGKYYFVQVRSYLDKSDVDKICGKFGVPAGEFNKNVSRLLEVGPEHFAQLDQGMAFWQAVWAALHLEERLVAVDSLLEVPLPMGMKPSHVEEFVGESADLRFHLSSGAVESFSNTIPLLHPRGFLEVQDIFVAKVSDYMQGFRGPGKLDGSILNWVNGAMLAEIGRQAGYDVHFAPFRYREKSNTSILYTTQREQ
jgi:hypothetical protein